MADLSAVLRKTIDALPAAGPQLRNKVYEKARAAIQRQIDAANPPLSEEMVDARRRALEQAISDTEAHYTSATASGSPEKAAPPPPPAEELATPRAPASPPPATPPSVQRPASQPPEPAPSASPVVAPSIPPRPPEPTVASEVADQRPFDPPAAAQPAPPRSAESYGLRPARAETAAPVRVPVAPIDEPSADAGARIGEVGPVSDAPDAPAPGISDRPGEPEPADGSLDAIPQPDMAAPNYSRPRRRSRNGSLYAGLAALLFVGALGAVGYLYSDEISRAISGAPEQVATSGQEPAVETEEDVAALPAEEQPAATEGPAPAAPDPGSRQFTQRLLPDGTEVDEGPATSVPNAFEEGTDVSAASLIPADELAQAAAPEAEAADPEAVAGGGSDPQAVPVAQRAVFYEERSADRPGSQHGGNVVWSVVSEPPAVGQPAEPAIRAVADVSETDMRMTMTIRRNADQTLPASHVIEILFDVPADFPGGEIENVQRLALKPTEQARGEPLIGVAGKISDGFFIIALNDLQQAVDNNLNLLANEQWIDIPLAYATGQRALISLEKGIPGERVFREALDAWAERT